MYHFESGIRCQMSHNMPLIAIAGGSATATCTKIYAVA